MYRINAKLLYVSMLTHSRQDGGNLKFKKHNLYEHTHIYIYIYIYQIILKSWNNHNNNPTAFIHGRLQLSLIQYVMPGIIYEVVCDDEMVTSAQLAQIWAVSSQSHLHCFMFIANGQNWVAAQIEWLRSNIKRILFLSFAAAVVYTNIYLWWYGSRGRRKPTSLSHSSES